MNKETFIATYVVNFMATHAATNYVDACLHGAHDKLYSKRMIEEAESLGLQTWENLSEYHKEDGPFNPWIAP